MNKILFFNDQTEWKFILDAMFDREANSNSSDVVTTLINLREKQAIFVPKGHMDDFTDPSYHLPHFYELWAVWDQQLREFRQQAAVTSHMFFTKAAHPQAGLAAAKIDDRSAEGELELNITADGNTYSFE